MNEFYLLDLLLHFKKSHSYPIIFLKDERIYNDDVLNDRNNYTYRICKNVPTEGLFFYHTEHLMTPLQTTDESASTIWQAEYYPFGRIYSQSGEIESNLRFPGQYSE